MLKFNEKKNILNKHDSNYCEEYEGLKNDKKWKFEKDLHVVVTKKKWIILES